MIAVPITANTVAEAVKQIELANKDADVIELRLDCFRELSEKDLKKIIGECKKIIICTCRRKEEGGLFNEPESKRIGVLKKCMKLNSDFIDLEFGTNKTQKDKIFEYKKEHKLKTKIIISKHFYGFTPELQELEKLLAKMKKNADVVKIITKANSHEDNKIIFSLLKLAKKKGIKLISFCMGKTGRDSRILALPLGSFLTFASLEKGNESADGQIPIIEMKKIYSGLRVMF
ncbi:MAG: type I 3-dehydroquinate dehydratase [archaeon]|nr:type I 3-dehydroquinate dehydratase [archaeon]